jgi:hypothetical protein
MARSFLGVAFINGQLRSGLDVSVIHNRRDRLSEAVEELASLVSLRSSPDAGSMEAEPMCFVLMPFREPFDEVYEDHIEPIVKHCGLQCQRADRIFSTQPVLDDIRDAVRRAKVIISDLTGNNPNVYYETGLCHSMGKQVVLVTQEDGAAFDVQHFRRIPYIFTPRGMKLFEQKLEKTLKEVVSDS